MDKIISEVKIVLEELLSRLEMYNNGEINDQVNEIKRALCIIESDMNPIQKNLALKRIQKNIYPANGGLTDFYVWKNDEIERIAINKPISRLGDKLWDLIKFL